MKLSRFHIQSLAFVLVVFMLVVFGPVGSNGESRRVDSEGRGSVAQTSLTAKPLIQSPTSSFSAVIPTLTPLLPKDYALAVGSRVLAFAKPQPLSPSKLPPQFSGTSALVKELNHGIVLFEQNPEQHWPLASLTKIMTALVASERFQLEKTITFNDNILSAHGE